MGFSYNTWGNSWATSWGNSWGQGGTPTPQPQGGGTSSKWKKKKKKLLRKDFPTEASYEAALHPVLDPPNPGVIDSDDDEILLMALTRILH